MAPHTGQTSPAPRARSIAGSAATALTDRQLRFVLKRRFGKDKEFQRQSHALHTSDSLVDFLVATANGHDPHLPDEVFPMLRWGGQFVFASRQQDQVVDLAKRFNTHGAWVIEQPPATLNRYPLNFRLLLVHKRLHYFVTRKTSLIKPGESSERFTYNVNLTRHAESGSYIVMKQVPTFDRVVARLREKFPDADIETLRRRARKFTEKIFPVFLTRETAILKLLQRDLPSQFAAKVPQVVSAEQDSQGYVRTLYLKWLRNGRGDKPPLTQLQFARQAAELLVAIHDTARVIHLDLRLDNVVITPDGVGFVDFGSAVRVGESFPEASLLSTLFEEMMRTSQIQRMLGKMAEGGMVTSQEIRNSYHRIDKAVDFFYLAVQINAPLSNPDFRGLVTFEKDSPEARELATLTELILRPKDPEKPAFKSARDILDGILEIERRLKR